MTIKVFLRRLWQHPAGYYSLAFGLGLVLAALYTWPVITDPGRLIPGRFEADQYQNIWSLWWFKRAVLDLHTNPYFSSYLFYPYGTDLYLYALEPLNGLLAVPVTKLFGPIAAYSLLSLGNLALTSAVGTALGYNASGSRLAGLICGPAISFSVIHFSYVALGQLEFVGLWPLLLYLTCLVKLLYRPGSDSSAGPNEAVVHPVSIWLVVGAAVSLLLAGFETLYYVAYAAIFTLVLGGARLLQLHRWQPVVSRVWRVGLAWLLFGLGFGLFAFKVYQAQGQHQLEIPYVEVIHESVAVQSYFSQFDGNSLLGHWLGLPEMADLNVSHYLGYSLIGLAGLGLGLRGRYEGRKRWPWPWLITAIFCAALSFGPTLRLDSSPKSTLTPPTPWLPWNWLDHVPLLNLTNTPKRFELLVVISLAVLAAMGIRELVRSGKRWATVGLSLLVIGLVLEGPAWPGLSRAVEIPPQVWAVQQDCEVINCKTSAVLDLPFSKDHYVSDAKLMLWGALRQKPVLGGYVSRPIDDPYDPAQSVFRVFRQLNPINDIFQPDADDAELQILNFYHVRYITVNYREYTRIYGPPAEQLRDFLQNIVGKQALIYQDNAAQIEVYRVPILKPVEKRPFMVVGQNWYPTEKSPAAQRWLTDNATVSIYSFDQRTADLSFEATGFEEIKHMQVSLNGQPVGQLTIEPGKWQKFSLTGLKLNRDQNELRFDPLEQAHTPAKFDPSSKDTRNLNVALRQVDLVSRSPIQV